MKWFTVARLGDHMEETPEGFLLIRDVPIARCGTQLYRHNEVPQLEADAAGWLRIDREPQEVFHADTLASYEGKPLVDDHPDEPVTPSNWADLAIGHIANIRRGSNSDHDLLFADILVTTDKGIRLIRRGKRAVSVGYDATYEQQGRGRGRQTRIIANHLALVDEGRCGTRCTILDGAARFLDSEAGPAGIPISVKIETAPAPAERPHVAVHGDLMLEYRADPAGTPLYQPRRDPAHGSTWHDLDYAQTADIDWREGEHPRDEDGRFGVGGGEHHQTLTGIGFKHDAGGVYRGPHIDKANLNQMDSFLKVKGWRHVSHSNAWTHPDTSHLAVTENHPTKGSTLKLTRRQTGDDFVEAEHPRDDEGKFSAGGGSKAATGAPVSTKGWKKVGGQLGSNPGAQLTDPSGQKHYVKFAKSEAHARNEHLAAKLYEAAGAPVLNTKLVDTGGGKVGTATAWAPDRRDIDIADIDDRRQAHRHFATHAWLANWDAAGLAHDNQAEVDGEMTTLDPGGALIFRAQGGPKGAAFGHQASEWDSLRQPSNKQAHELFGEMTAAQLRDSAGRVAAVPSAVIRELTLAHGPGTAEQRQALADKLVNRRNDVAKRAGLKTVDRAFSWRDMIAVRRWAGGITISIRGRDAQGRARDDSQGWQGQPRVAAGQEGGGQWTEGGGGGAPALPEMKSKYFQKEAGKLQQAVSSAYASGGKQAALAAAQGLLGKWKHSVMQGHMAKAIQAIQAHPEQGGAPSEAEMEAMAAEHEPPPPEPSVAPVGEPKTGSQKNVQYILNHPDLSTGEKIAKLKDKIAGYVNPENAAYAQAAIAQLQGGGTSAPPPPPPPVPLPAAAPAPAAPTAAKPAAAAELPAPEAGNTAQEWLHAVAAGTGAEGKHTTQQLIQNVHTELKHLGGPNAKAYAAEVLEALHTKAAQEAPDGLPPPGPLSAVQESMHALAKNNDVTEAYKLASVEEDIKGMSSPQNIAYGKAMLKALKAGGGQDVPASSAPEPAAAVTPVTPPPAPAKPKPPPQPQGPAPFAGSPGQEKVHAIATDPKLSSAEKLAQIEAVKSDTNISGPKTQEFANQWQEAIKKADPAGTATPAAAPSAAAKPAAAAKAAKPKASPDLHTSGNKKLHARYSELRKNAASVSSAYDAKAKELVQTMDKAWWPKNSTAAQRTAIQDYKDSSYGINGYLRDPTKGSGKAQQYAHDIDEVFEHDDAVLQQDTLCMRGEQVEAKVLEEWKAGLAAGHHVRPQRTGFTSTALANKVPSSFSGQNVVYEIVARKGARALGFWGASNSHQTENEMVLRHGTAIEVYEIEKVGSQHIVRCVTV